MAGHALAKDSGALSVALRICGGWVLPLKASGGPLTVRHVHQEGAWDVIVAIPEDVHRPVLPATSTPNRDDLNFSDVQNAM